MIKNYDDFLWRKEREYGSKFDSTDLNVDFIPYYESNVKIEVSFRDKDGIEYEVKRGRIGITTGWKPCFLLMLTRRSLGSSWIIGPNDKVIRVIA